MKVKLLPYEKFEIITELPPEEVVRKLRENTEPWSIDPYLFRKGKIFEGTIRNSSFTISCLWQGTPIRSVGFGKIENRNGGSMITVEMKLHPLYVIFIILMPSLFFILTIIFFIFPFDREFGIALIFNWVVIVFAWVGTRAFFNIEVSDLRNFILKIIGESKEKELK
jgi:hypothetical protein